MQKWMLYLVSALACTTGLTACQKPTEPKAEGAAASTASTSNASTASTSADNSTAVATNSGTDAQKILIATEPSFVPFSFKDADGKMAGFEIDLAAALCQEAKLNCEVIPRDWDGIIPGLQAKKYHAIMAGMSITPERSKVINFSDPYFYNKLVLVVSKVVILVRLTWQVRQLQYNERP